MADADITPTATTASATSQLVDALSSSIQSLSDASESVQDNIDELSGDNKSGPLRIVGIVLAVASGAFIGSSFVFKKKGLLASEAKYDKEPGTGTAYLKSFMWWIGMIFLVIGEALNFVAYSLTDAIIVTPLGALSVVICAILSAIFLKEHLSFFGKIGCALCIVGSTVIALNGPKESTAETIKEFQKLALSPGFLVWLGLSISIALFLIFVAAPRWGKKNMLVYVMICSLFGGLSVSTTSGLGASIVTSIQGDNQVTHYFFWILFAFVAITLIIELIFLNKALALFNTAMVTPTYYVIFTFLTLVTSAILNQGFKAPVTDLITIVLGFLTICGGITLLQMSKVDPETLPLDRRATLLLSASKAPQEPLEKDTDLEDPGVDTVRGGFGAVGSIYRARSVARAHSVVSEHGVMRSPTARRRKSTQSRRPSALTTVGLQDLPRTTLYDSPGPDDTVSRKSMNSSSNKSPVRSPKSPPFSADLGSGRFQYPTIGFSPDVKRFRYGGYGRDPLSVEEIEEGESKGEQGPSSPAITLTRANVASKKENEHEEWKNKRKARRVSKRRPSNTGKRISSLFSNSPRRKADGDDGGSSEDELIDDGGQPSTHDSPGQYV